MRRSARWCSNAPGSELRRMPDGRHRRSSPTHSPCSSASMPNGHDTCARAEAPSLSGGTSHSLLQQGQKHGRLRQDAQPEFVRVHPVCNALPTWIMRLCLKSELFGSGIDWQVRHAVAVRLRGVRSSPGESLVSRARSSRNLGEILRSCQRLATCTPERRASALLLDATCACTYTPRGPNTLLSANSTASGPCR